MKDIVLRKVALWLTIAAAAVAAASVFSAWVRSHLVLPATIVTAAMAGLLFVLMLIRPIYRIGPNERDWQTPEPSSEAKWSLLPGYMGGDPKLRWATGIISAAFILVALAQNWLGIEVVYLVLAAAFVAIQLTLMEESLAKAPDA